MEFRLYDRNNCSVFDLIGKLEPDQTKGLGLLLSKSEGALNEFLSLIGLSVRQYDKYVVDCETRDFKNKRYDILIRFYRNNNPLEAILLEAKGVGVSHASHQAISQVKNYASFQSFQLNGFQKKTLVTLTHDTTLLNSNQVKSITWSQLISAFYEYAKNQKDDLASDFVNYLLSIEGSMNYYEEDILSIPAGKTIAAILKSGIYECPIEGRHYTHQRRTLYIAFKNAKGGAMDTLYKLHDIIEGVDLNDLSQIAVLENMQGYTGIGTRIAAYKSCVKYSQDNHEPKRLFVLDLENSISLPNSVRPLENNSNWPYYKLKDFLQPVNSNKGQVVVQNSVLINGNDLIVKSNGKKMYDLYESGLFINSFVNNALHTLNVQENYYIDVYGVNRGGYRCRISINYINGSWKFFYNL